MHTFHDADLQHDPMHNAIYADDTVLLLAPPTVDAIIPYTTTAAEVVVSSFNSFAGTLNVKRRNTEAMIAVRGNCANGVQTLA